MMYASASFFEELRERVGMTKCIDGDYVDAEDVDALVEKIMKEVCE